MDALSTYCLLVVQGHGVASSVQCEMDPIVEVDLRAEVEACGIQVVGWYHSHPTFEPTPSQCDIDNQCNYQAFFRDHVQHVDPFVGLIISPFDLRLPSLLSASLWFNVASPTTLPTPMLIEVEYDFNDGVLPTEVVEEEAGPPGNAALDATLQHLVRLLSAPSLFEFVCDVRIIRDVVLLQKRSVSACISNVEPVDPQTVWRDLGGAVTNMQKLHGTLAARCTIFLGFEVAVCFYCVCL